MDIGGVRRIYALAWVSYRNGFKVDGVSSVPYQSVRFMSFESQSGWLIGTL